MSDELITIHTDGACAGNPGPGGWGAVLESGEHYAEIKGGAPDTTNNRMELTAAIEALKVIVRENATITLYTDSVYLRDGVTKWMAGWKKNGWKTSARKAVKNVELWQELDKLASGHTIEWLWVKGHAGNKGNERADVLANEGMEPHKSAGQAR